MSFEIEITTDIFEKLRDLEPQAPKHIKPVMLQAANELNYRRMVMQDVADELEAAANLKIGTMDSPSRIFDITQHIRSALMNGVERLRKEIEYV